MTTAAWITFTVTCTTITIFTVYFFIKVVKKPGNDDES